MLSTFIVTKDGAKLLPAVIKNLRTFAEEVIVIVDRDTVDESLQVAESLADSSYMWQVDGSYESVLNEAAALCKYRWILYSHDDELWDRKLRAELMTLTRDGYEQYSFNRIHVVGDGTRWINSDPLWPDPQLRLRTDLSWKLIPWPRKVHSVPERRNWRLAESRIWHYKFIVKSQRLREQRMKRWGEMWSESLNDHYRRFSLPEDFAYETAALDTAPPVESAEWIKEIVSGH